MGEGGKRQGGEGRGERIEKLRGRGEGGRYGERWIKVMEGGER